MREERKMEKKEKQTRKGAKRRPHDLVLLRHGDLAGHSAVDGAVHGDLDLPGDLLHHGVGLIDHHLPREGLRHGHRLHALRGESKKEKK